MEQFRSPDPNGPGGSLLVCTIREFMERCRDCWCERGEAGQNGEVLEYETSPAREACL